MFIKRLLCSVGEDGFNQEEQGGGAGDQGQQGGVDQGQQREIDPNTGKFIPIERFNQVNTGYQTYKKFGTPEEIRARLERLDLYERQIEEHRASQRQQDPKEKIRRELYDVDPNLKNIPDVMTAVEQMQERLWQRDVKSHFTDLTKEHGITFENAKQRDRVETYLQSRMTDEEQERFAQGDLSVLTSVFEDEIKTGLLSSLKSTKKGANPPPPPVRHGAGGAPPKPPEGTGKPKTFQDAGAAAWAAMLESKKG